MKHEKVRGGEQPNQPFRHQMKNKSIILIAVAALSLVLPSAALAQTDGSILFNPNIDLSTLSQNDYVGYVGSQFLSAGGTGETVNYFGFYDAGGDGLANSHTMALWETGWNGQSSRGLLAEITVPAGTSAPLIDGYRWVELPSTITLVPNEYYLLNASVDGVDQWGDVISGSQITWNSQYVPTDSGYDFTKAGVYGDTIPAYSQNGGSDSIDPAANLGYDVVPAPEPTTLSLMGIGMAAVLGFKRRQRR
jgi:hypothetical protein